MKNDFSQWYLDALTDAEFFDYSPVRGCMVFRPNGYSVWEKIQQKLDKRFKETGHQNCYFPVLIPESFINKEKDHVEGFSPELALVTHAGGKELEEPYAIRPTSETIIWHMFKKWIRSHRDLPLKVNQWANVMRWEMRTRPFLRTSEFLWQEGHTAHATSGEAIEETNQMLQIYKTFIEEEMAIPVLDGQKSDKEKFPGAESTYTVELMMRDCKALQGGTSHYLGQNFSKVFDVTFATGESDSNYPFATSWGVSTRLIGALVMVHGDEKGIILPPRMATTPVVIVPIWKGEERDNVLHYVNEDVAPKLNVSFKIDDRDELKPGAKFNYWEKRGIPLRIEMGMRDIENKQVVLVNRLTFEKETIGLNHLGKRVDECLSEIQLGLFNRAKQFAIDHTYEFTEYKPLSKMLDGKGDYSGGFGRVPWCGKCECENAFQERNKATIRIVEELKTPASCIVCGTPATKTAVVAKAY